MGSGSGSWKGYSSFNCQALLLQEIILNQDRFVLYSPYLFYTHAKFHSLRAQNTVAVKPNTENVYDTLRWDFLHACLTQLGFERPCIEKILLCVPSVKFNVEVNSEHTEKFQPECCLHQGDPLSPYLYILCAETLARQAAKMAASKRLLFPKIAPNGGQVSVHQFADDLLLFLST